MGADLLSELLAKKGGERVMKWMAHFETALGDKPFFTGEKITYVDYVILGPFQVIALKQAAGVADVEGVTLTPQVKAWYEKIIEDPAAKAVIAKAPILPAQYV